MRPTRITALVLAAVTLAASPSPAEAFFFPLPLFPGRPPTVAVNPSKGPIDNMGRGNVIKSGKASTGIRSTEEDSKPSRASTGTRSKDDDNWSSRSGKRAKSGMKDEANANSGHGGRQTPRRWSVEHDPPASKSSGRASTSVQRAGSGGANSDTQGKSFTGADSNAADTFDENLVR